MLASTRAKEVSKEDAPRLHNLVEGLAIAAGTPTPKVWIVPESAPNAFATGRDPEHSHVAVTQGLLETMNRVELEGAIGHEMAHVLDRDILVGTVVATLVGAAVLLAEFFMRMWWWGGVPRQAGEHSVVASAIIFAGFLLLILAPIFGQLIRLAVSRNREFLADAQGAMLTRYPPGPIAAPHEAPVGAHRDALREQRDRAPLAESALAAGRGAARDAGAAVLDASPARGAHPSPGGDVTFPSRCPGGVWADGCPEIVSIVGSREGPVRRFPHISSHPDIENQEAHPWH